MKKEDLYNSFDSIIPDDKQRARMLDRILDKSQNLNTSRFKRPKFMAIAVAICLMTTTVIATNISSFLNLKDKINPDMVEFIEPIEEVCIDQGIKMEVVAVGRYDNMVKAYITFQDLEGERIKEDISFLDYYSLSGSDFFGWSLVDYNENEKKVTILLEASNTANPFSDDMKDDLNFKDENLTFKVSNIFYDHREYEDREIEIDLTEIDTNPPYSKISNHEQILSGSTGIYERLLVGHTIPALKPHVLDFKFPEVDSSMISNIGIIDGKLHIQTWRDKEVEGHGASIYLKDPNGERISTDYDFSFGDVDENGEPMRGNYPSYHESIYYIDLDRLDEYRLFGNFWTSEQLEGNWKVTFKAEDRGMLKIDKKINIGDMNIEDISITPFGVTLKGEGIFPKGTQDLDIKINTQTGVVRTSPSSSSQRYEKFTTLYNTEKPIDLEQIESITINGKIISIK